MTHDDYVLQRVRHYLDTTPPPVIRLEGVYRAGEPMKFWTWLKPKLLWILAGAGAVLGLVVAIVTMGRSRPYYGPKPTRPDLPDPKDVEVPVVKIDFNDKPADSFKQEKVEPDTRPDAVVINLNNRFK